MKHCIRVSKHCLTDKVGSFGGPSSGIHTDFLGACTFFQAVYHGTSLFQPLTPSFLVGESVNTRWYADATLFVDIELSSHGLCH